MTPTAIAAIAIPSAAALIWMAWEFIHAPLIEDEGGQLPDAERAARMATETSDQRLRRISKLPR